MVGYELQAQRVIIPARCNALATTTVLRQEVQHPQQFSLRAGKAADAASVQALRTERNLGIDFASGKRVSTAVRRARLEKSKGRVKRIRKIHGRSLVQLRLRLPQIAHAAVSKANHHGVAVTGLNETKLQQSWSQVASCLAKRLQEMSWTQCLTPWHP